MRPNANTDKYRDLTLADVPELKKMRDGAVKSVVERRFKTALEAMQDLKLFLKHRRVHDSYFLNMCKEILAISKEMSNDKTLLIDFEIYFYNHWRRD